MSILLAQLGDIHFRNATDVAVGRARSLGAAIAAEIASETSLIILAICGDAAFSGKQDQFLVASGFIQAIETAIRDQNDSVAIKRIAVPGNHDCDFSGDQAAREVLLSSVNAADKPKQSITSIILEPLNEYFTFAELACGGDSAISRHHPFYHPVDLRDGSLTLRLHLLNTAWMSSIHEQQGSLHFPLAEIVPPSERADYSIAILHHPTRWFQQPHVMRPLRDRLGQLVSVVLVNHEHVPEAVEEVPLYNRDSGVTSTVYVSGGVIQEDHDPNLCNFNILLFNFRSKEIRLTRHDFKSNKGEPHFERTDEAVFSISRNELVVGPAGASLTEDMIKYLEDPGVPVTHPRRDPRIPIRLIDIFLYPDLWELDSDHKGGDQKLIRSAEVANEVLNTPKVLITGGEKSGRTSIVKSLFMEAFNNGQVPLFLRGGDLPKNANKLRGSIRDAVKKQYSNLTPDAFEQLEKKQRVLLIDDVQRMAPASHVRQELLNQLEQQFGKIILCGDELTRLDEVGSEELRNSGLWDYRHLVSLGFGEYLREQFVRQWLMLGGDTVADDDILEEEVERICGLLNVVIKRQLLPTYPLFLLVVLQQSDLANASVQGGAFGKLFEAVITAILDKSDFRRINIGDKYFYLAGLAKKMYDEKELFLSMENARKWHNAYWEEIEVSIDFNQLLKDLERLGVLSVSDTEIRFKYAYFFCFFLAYYLNRNMHQDESQQIITKLCRQLHHRMSSDVVLFLAHLTSNPIVLDEMIKTCDQLFSDSPQANLDSDVEPLNRLGSVIDTIAIPDMPSENRLKLKLRRDELIEERLEATKANQELVAPESDDAITKRLFEIHAAYKTIEILGQALRNISGSASKARKEEIIDKIIGLSKRILGSYFEYFSTDHLSDVIQGVAQAHREQQPELASAEIFSRVSRHLVGLSQFVCFTVVKHTTFSVGSENLAPTIDRILGESTGVAERIFGLSFDLERPKRFPKEKTLKLYQDLNKNFFSANVVRDLVAHHIYMFDVPYDIRQAIADKLSIEFQRNVLDKTRKRLANQ